MVRFKTSRDGDMVVLDARDTDTGQRITFRFSLGDARLLSTMLSIAVDGSEEVSEESEDTLALPPAV